MYGLLTKEHLKDMVNDVVDNFGGGKNAYALLLETAQIESKSGTYPYNPFRDYGIGVMQFDRIAFDDVKARTKQSIKDKVYQIYGLDINKLAYEDLRFSPLYSVLFARLHYRLIPDAIPDTLEDRAEYWFEHYNRAHHLGKDIQVQKYIEANKG
jgi:hypothetical protein